MVTFDLHCHHHRYQRRRRRRRRNIKMSAWLICSIIFRKAVEFCIKIHSETRWGDCLPTFSLPQLSSGRRQWHPTPVLLPGKSHGQRSLVGCSPWGRWGSDITERLHFPFALSCIGEGNGNPLQCSCLENPRDESLVGCCLWGRTESDVTDVTAAAAAIFRVNVNKKEKP